jgi:hypothetical protein
MPQHQRHGGECIVAGHPSLDTAQLAEALVEIQLQRGLVAFEHFDRQRSRHGVDRMPHERAADATAIAGGIDVEPAQLVVGEGDEAVDAAIGFGDTHRVVEQPFVVGGLRQRQERGDAGALAQLIEPRGIVDDAEPFPVGVTVGTHNHVGGHGR